MSTGHKLDPGGEEQVRGASVQKAFGKVSLTRSDLSLIGNMEMEMSHAA